MGYESFQCYTSPILKLWLLYLSREYQSLCNVSFSKVVQWIPICHGSLLYINVFTKQLNCQRWGVITCRSSCIYPQCAIMIVKCKLSNVLLNFLQGSHSAFPHREISNCLTADDLFPWIQRIFLVTISDYSHSLEGLNSIWSEWPWYFKITLIRVLVIAEWWMNKWMSLCW